MAHRGWGGVLSQIGVLMASGTTTGLTDGQLLERFGDRRGSGAEAAFEALVARHGSMVRHVCFQVLRHEHDADDAFQAVFLVLARRAGSIRNPDLLASWLHGVALRTARVARRRRATGLKLIQGPAPDPADDGQSPDQQSAGREEAEALHEEIGRLPDAQRHAVVLCHFQGLTHEEASRRLGIPPGTVGVRLMRARERLRARLGRRGLAPTSALLVVPIPATLDPAALHASSAITFIRGGAAGEVPAGVASLAEGVLRTMSPLKLKLAVALMGFGLATAGAWSLAKGPARVARPRAVVLQPQAVPEPSAEERALAEFRKVYRLDPGQVIKRIPPPFAAWRMADAEVRFPFLKENRERRGHLTTLIYHERNGVLDNPSMTFSGSPDDEGRWLMYLLDGVVGFPAQDVEGPDDLLKTPIKADWVVRGDASPEQLVAAFNSLLRDDCKLPIRIKLREAEKDVIVARGRYQFRPVVGGRDVLEIYGAALIPNEGGGGTGDLKECFRWVGRFVEPHRHIIDEVEGRPKGQISWHQNYRSPFSDQTTLEDRGDEAVLKHLAEQTGLTFTTERRKLRSLVVERVERVE